MKSIALKIVAFLIQALIRPDGLAQPFSTSKVNSRPDGGYDVEIYTHQVDADGAQQIILTQYVVPSEVSPIVIPTDAELTYQSIFSIDTSGKPTLTEKGEKR